MLYRGTKSRVRLAQKTRLKAACKTRANCNLSITPPTRVAGLSSTDNSVFRCGSVENNHLRLPDLFIALRPQTA